MIALRDALVEVAQDKSKGEEAVAQSEVRLGFLTFPHSCTAGKEAEEVVRKAMDERMEKNKKAAAAGDL